MKSWSRQIMEAEQKKRARPKNLEHDAQVQYFTTLGLNQHIPTVRWIHASMNGASASSRASAGRRKAAGQKAGVADILIPVPRRGFHGAWFELKIAPNRLSPEQKQFLVDMQAMGYYAEIAWSYDDLIRFTEYYLGITLRGVIGRP